MKAEANSSKIAIFIFRISAGNGNAGEREDIIRNDGNDSTNCFFLTVEEIATFQNTINEQFAIPCKDIVVLDGPLTIILKGYQKILISESQMKKFAISSINYFKNKGYIQPAQTIVADIFYDEDKVLNFFYEYYYTATASYRSIVSSELPYEEKRFTLEEFVEFKTLLVCFTPRDIDSFHEQITAFLQIHLAIIPDCLLLHSRQTNNYFILLKIKDWTVAKYLESEIYRNKLNEKTLGCKFYLNAGEINSKLLYSFLVQVNHLIKTLLSLETMPNCFIVRIRRFISLQRHYQNLLRDPLLLIPHSNNQSGTLIQSRVKVEPRITQSLQRKETLRENPTLTTQP
jgi:hypothetical protein